ncbi:MAG TPA: hypothetical protein VES91_07400 [Burkholderiaceae bacterium]|nr:hypothetical protein [Burkholderiaceae bacterium]
MKRNFLVGAALSALVLAAMAPWSASRANGISVRVNTPEFGIRIGAPYHRPPPVYYPAPVYHPVPIYHPAPVYGPPPVIYAPPPRYIAPPPVVYGYPYHYAGGRGYGHQRHHWRHPHWRHDRRHHDDDRQRHWR